ncbi:hypothetical protein QAD02_016703 [Eretmocerus hayati]|uniref:Uncharacterized protein n=1 Tax=Eretmocerus hayati TaxID=131215 RepID=A0ACC2PBT7_9HYME|nr:hypothetical protein QAD02_016703 [Eretmocerus hayati]
MAEEESPSTLAKVQDAYRLILDLKLGDLSGVDFMLWESPVSKFSETNDAWSISFRSCKDANDEDCGLRFQRLADSQHFRPVYTRHSRSSPYQTSSVTLRIDSQKRPVEQTNIYQVVCSILKNPECGLFAFQHQVQNHYFTRSELQHPKFFSLNDLLKAASGSDRVKLCFEISVFPDIDRISSLLSFPNSREGSHTPEGKEPSPLSMSMYSFTQNGNFSDITIRTNDHDFKVHKIVLAAKSPVFATMFHSQMQEVLSGIINVDDVRSEAMGELIRYIYTNEVKDLHRNVHDLFILAHKYNIIDLENSCLNYIKNHIEPKNVAKLLELSEIFNLKDVAESIKKFIRRHEGEVVKQNDFVYYLTERLSPHSIASVLILANKYMLNTLKEKAYQFIAQNFMNVVRDPEYRELYLTHHDIVLEVDEYISRRLG